MQFIHSCSVSPCVHGGRVFIYPEAIPMTSTDAEKSPGQVGDIACIG